MCRIYYYIYCLSVKLSTSSSSIDIELPPQSTDAKYISSLKTWLPYLLDIVKPDLVFFQAGVDIHINDRLGKLAVSREGIRRRNRIVYRHLLKRGIKCVTTMGGGYPLDLDENSNSFKELVQLHCDVYRDCMEETLN